MTDSWTRTAGDWQRKAWITGFSALGISFVGGLFSPARFFQSYLLAFLWVLGIALGCMPLLMLHHLVGGRWGYVIRRPLEAATRTLPLVAVLFLPVLIGMDALYEWTHAGALAADERLRHKSAYLNTGFFIARAAVYFGAWLTWAYFLNRWSREQDRTGAREILPRLQLLSAAGILVYALTISFASIDWLMSLDPDWYSTIFGMILIAGQLLSALAFSVLVLAVLSRRSPIAGAVTPRHLHDLGNLILTFVLLWAYLSFSQYLIIWSGNLPEEIPFYLERTAAGWQTVALALIVFHFALPFILLLSRRNKRTSSKITAIAAGLLVLRWVDLYWLIAPVFEGPLTIHWLDLTLPAGIGAVWSGMFLRQLAREPLLPLHDPRIAIPTGAEELSA